ncbi:MAG: hypothetical protein UV73_C0011G0017 [Candidatus Gottesmanbacteria bacterium GW2011_GWA2_43_14]|uniref:Uncharacterized protein n=1 Tax=Candidatus Gottesmanbacteria bacterium GW2011_GWA2_43_14 TaxID=1618443 RepID=A0A0G1DEL9_9BACT|nr:MAG: hypothetical protein UV73_C0011G0017 [Candidatus Gottesmanbacteria bacterium GW2011_GWA2_43_14]
MQVNPVAEEAADGQVRENYRRLKIALNSASLPAFFTYLGAFQEYLDYLTGQLTDNLEDGRFKTIASELSNEFVTKIGSVLKKSDRLEEWLTINKQNPSFYNFQRDLQSIILINVKLACIFVALREAVKGWAVAAKQLPRSAGATSPAAQEFKNDEFISEYILKETVSPDVASNSALAVGSHAITGSGNSLARNLLPEYLRLCDSDLNSYMKKDYFWVLRVQLEEKILSVLSTFPHLIFSPYNVMIEYTQKYANFYELLYFLYEKFPTLAMQRLIFSAYMHF